MLELFRRAALFGAMVGLGGCTLLGNSSHQYPMTTAVKQLEVPPSLKMPPVNQVYAIPPATSPGPQSAGMAAAVGSSSTVANVLPQVPGMRLEQAGAFHWLVVNESPARVWLQVLHDFKSQGFSFAEENPRIGVLRTQWRQNPHGLPKGLLGGLPGNLYDSGKREAYVVRLAPGLKSGVTEIYLSYQEALEFRSAQGGLDWAWVPPNPGKEVSALLSLMQTLGATPAQLHRAATHTASSGSRYVLTKQGGQPVIVAPLPITQAWPQVGLALDRANLIVIHANRHLRIYEVSYREVSQSNFFQRLFEKRSKLKPGTRFMIQLVSLPRGRVAIYALKIDGQYLSPTNARLVLRHLFKGLG